MGISRDSHHKRSATGAKRADYRNKRKFQLGRQPANTKIGSKRIHLVRVMGGNFKCRAMRLDTGNFAWGSETVSRKTRLIDVVYNPTNNELVRTKTLVKGSIVQVDATPFRQWWESYYGQLLGKKRIASAAETAQATDSTTKDLNNKSTLKRIKSRSNDAHVEPLLEEQFATGRLYAIIKSRPGQSGRCDGYILEGKELEFYARKIRAKK